MVKTGRITDLTIGNPTKLIISFMIPLLGANVMQQLYTIIDTIIVGRGVGIQALAAVGATDMLRLIAVWGIAGFADGFGILMTINFGSKNYKSLRQIKNMSIFLSLTIALILSVIGVVFSRPLMTLTNVPADIFTSARNYMMIIYGGCMAMMLYSVSASILRAVGDSKTPFIGILISSVLNIVLDLIAVYILHWGVEGTAAATVISQLFSGIYCMSVISRIDILKRPENEKRFHWKWIGNLMGKGTPMAFQNSFIAVGGVILQSVINRYGSEYVAGFTATNKIYMLIEGAAIALGGAMMAYIGQNYGANNIGRISQGLKKALLISLVISAVLAVVMILFGKYVLMLFISADPETEAIVLGIAYKYLVIMCCLLFVLYVLHIYRSGLMGLGNTRGPLGSGIAEFSCRVFVALVITRLIGANGLFFAEVSAWFGAVAVMLPVFYHSFRQISSGNVVSKK